jgi:hypothetical protein
MIVKARQAGANMSVDVFFGSERGDPVANLAVMPAHPNNPRVDTVVKRPGRVEILYGTPTYGANLENLLGRSCLREGDEIQAFVLVASGARAVLGQNIASPMRREVNIRRAQLDRLRREGR